MKAASSVALLGDLDPVLVGLVSIPVSEMVTVAR